MGRILINCDLGENETDEQTERLLDLVDAANICCGVHAGSEDKTRRTLELASQRKLLIGAHPGLAADGGRGSELPSVELFKQTVTEQIADFLELAMKASAPVTYVKLHGSLYHAVEKHTAYAEAYLDVLTSGDFMLDVFALAGGSFAGQARDAGIKVWAEGFIDRGYLSDGSLAPRSEEGAVLDAETALARFNQWQQSLILHALNGEPIRLEADTFCVHSDSTEAEAILKRLKQTIQSA